MKKFLKVVIIAIMLVAIVATFCACSNDYKWDAVGSTKYSSSKAVGNGTFAVQQGKYLYFVNGAISSTILSADANAWGKASVKGEILKAEIKDDGTLKCLGVVVPKLFYSAYEQSGLYVYGEWIYYVTPTIEKDNKGNLETGTEYMRTKLDGTKTESICIVEDTAAAYIFTSKGLLYVEDSNIYFVSYTNDKIGDAKKVVSSTTDVEVSLNDCCIFYTVASGDDQIASNKLGVVKADGTKKEITKTTTFGVITDLAHQYTIAIIGYDDVTNTLFYTKTACDAAKAVGTYSYKFDSTYAFTKDNEIKYANSALTKVYSLGYTTEGLSRGILSYSDAATKIYNPILETATQDNTSDSITFSAAVTILFSETQNDVNYVYYLKDSCIYRANIFTSTYTPNTEAYEEKISDATVSTNKINPKKLGDYIYYVSADDSSYLYRMDYKAYTLGDNTLTKVNGYMVSGYKAYSYGDDDEFVVNKDDALIKDKVPKYMTSDDLKTYVSAHKTDNE